MKLKIESVTLENNDFKIVKVKEGKYLPLLLESYDISKDSDIIYGTIYLRNQEELDFFGSKIITIKLIKGYNNKERKSVEKFMVKTAYGNEFIYEPVNFESVMDLYEKL